jgi:hypothetical protein
VEFGALGKARNSFALRNLAFGIVGLGMVAVAPSAAWASAGCTALNGTYSAGAATGSASGTVFSAGDVITLTTNVIGGGDTIGLYDNTTHGILIDSATTVVGTRTYTVPANTSDNFIISGTQINAGSNFAWSCAAAATGTTGSTTTPADSQKLTSVQTAGSNVAANQSGSATSNAVNSAINSQLDDGSSSSQSQVIPWSTVWNLLRGTNYSQIQAVYNNNPDYLTSRYHVADINVAQITNDSSALIASGYLFAHLGLAANIRGPFNEADYFTVTGNPNDPGTWKIVRKTASNYAAERPSAVARQANQAFAQLGNGVLAMKAPGKVQYLSGLWSVWGDLTGSGFDQSNAGAMHGNQVNATAGIGYRLRDDAVVGVFGGYENFNYDFAALAGRLKGDGGTVGGYGGWAITPALHWNTMLGWTGLSYDGSAGAAAGSFGGSRWLFSTGLTGNYRVGQFVLEPSAMIYALTEHQRAYTDTLGTAHASRDFSTGRVSLGGRALLPARADTPLAITPYVGLYGDWRFASDNALPAGVPFVGIGDGWSARVAGGLSMPVLQAGTLSLGGDYGGIGADYKVWTGKANVSVPF